MLYFKKLDLLEVNGQTIENAIRKYSIKRNTSLDIQSSTSYITEEKYFLGLDSEFDIKITRIRTPFERLFPKLIVSLSKEDFRESKIRLSLLSTILLFIVILIFLFQIIYSIRSAQISSDLIGFSIFLIAFLGLSSLEIKLTTDRMKKAIRNVKVK
jgi:hypothetical protein